MSNSAAAATRIKEEIAEHPVVIFSKTTCGYCDSVKALFASLSVKDLQVVELNHDRQGHEIQQQLYRMTSCFTVPSVWVGSEYIGGCDKTLELHSRGALMPKVHAAVDAAAKKIKSDPSPDQSQVGSFIAENPLAVFCASEKEMDAFVELLETEDYSPAFLCIDKSLDDHEQMIAELGARSGSFVLPSIWIGGKHVGSMHDVSKLKSYGNLEPQIMAAINAHANVLSEEDRHADKLMDDFVRNNHVALFSKTYCRFSMAVKDLLEKSGASTAVFELDTHALGHCVLSGLARRTGRLTVPSVWIDGKHVGGCEETQKLFSSGALASLINGHSTS